MKSFAAVHPLSERVTNSRMRPPLGRFRLGVEKAHELAMAGSSTPIGKGGAVDADNATCEPFIAARG